MMWRDDAIERLRAAAKVGSMSQAADVRGALEEIAELRSIVAEHDNEERLRDLRRVAVVNVANLLGLTVESDEATAEAVYEWARSRRSERETTETAARLAEKYGVPEVAQAAHRQAADRVTALVVTELRALGWRAPGES